VTAPVAEELAAQVYQAILAYDREKPRSKQTEDFVVGVSELGFCSERTRRMLAGIVPEPTDTIAAFIGTAIGDYIERAVVSQFPGNIIRQAEVSCELDGDQGTYTLTGHPDLLFDWGVLDVKTTRGLEIVRRTGPSQQQQFQRHCYALGAHRQGLFGDLPLEDVQVANVWFDRAGEDKACHVQMEPFSPEQIARAAAWLDEVVYAYARGGPAMKEPPRTLCENYCGHFRDCRMLDTDVVGLLTDPKHLAAVEMYREGSELEKDGRLLKNQARANLFGVSGTTSTHALRWVWVNETVIPESHRDGYFKMSLSKIRL
jgi:hypothetical protein